MEVAASGCLFDSCLSWPQYFVSQERGRDLKKRQVIRSRCIKTRTPTCLDKPQDEAEEEDGFPILQRALEAPVVWLVPLLNASSILDVSKEQERWKMDYNHPNSKVKFTTSSWVVRKKNRCKSSGSSSMPPNPNQSKA